MTHTPLTRADNAERMQRANRYHSATKKTAAFPTAYRRQLSPDAAAWLAGPVSGA